VVKPLVKAVEAALTVVEPRVKVVLVKRRMAIVS
jgi:hypothetical protein